ncbi:MAG: transcriptional repressor [Leptolyngbyaceae cyanobacterium CRU_2_3]|nr:transcriptional repressor [Leptolyngbyaceae cyanobacterium CRU_2_3]
MSLYDLDSLKVALHERGFRMTAQREKILHIFKELPQGDHLSAEELHVLLQQEAERISLSTVYRTLHLMTQMGLLRELELAEGHKHYELNLPSPYVHHHLVCLQCNRTLEFKNDQILKIASRQAQLQGYHMLDCQLTLHVMCPEALKRGSTNRLSKEWRCDRPS